MDHKPLHPARQLLDGGVVKAPDLLVGAAPLRGLAAVAAAAALATLGGASAHLGRQHAGHLRLRLAPQGLQPRLLCCLLCTCLWTAQRRRLQTGGSACGLAAAAAAPAGWGAAASSCGRASPLKGGRHPTACGELGTG